MHVISVYFRLNFSKLYNGPIRCSLIMISLSDVIDRMRPLDGTFKMEFTNRKFSSVMKQEIVSGKAALSDVQAPTPT